MLGCYKQVTRALRSRLEAVAVLAVVKRDAAYPVQYVNSEGEGVTSQFRAPGTLAHM